MNPVTVIDNGEAVLGIELGSTRIKATLIAPDATPLGSGSYQWENLLVDGIWTYDMDSVWEGLAACYADLAANVDREYGVPLRRIAAIGISAMMHGYIALDGDGALLVPFRTWRNNITGEASAALTELFKFPVPQRWSIAHLYQAILNKEAHVPQVRRITTLSGYVHSVLTGEPVIGINDASGMFPVDSATGDYYREMVETFDAAAKPDGVSWKTGDSLPRIVPAGAPAGTLSLEGARLLDRTGSLQAGIPLCAPEGDAGTGMVATNSVRVRTGNVSAGTSVFAMIVLEKPLSQVYSQIDIVVTPDGNPVAMAHSNNCTSDLDAWIRMFHDAAIRLGADVSIGDVYEKLLPLALQGDPDAGGLLTYGYVSGEHMTGFSEGRPLFVRDPAGAFTLENVVRAHLYSALGAMRTGLDILTDREKVKVSEIRGHGGFFKVDEVGQRVMAAATGVPVRVQETAGEGGAWGMAILAAYMQYATDGQDLPGFLAEIFSGTESRVVDPVPAEVAGFNRYFERYTAGLAIERAAVDVLS